VTPKGRAGFSLTELVIAIGLFSVIMAGIGSFMGNVVRGQARLMTDNILDNAATVGRRSVLVALQSATCVLQPAAGGVSTELTALSNAQDDGVTPLSPAAPVRFTHLCVAANALHLYTGSGAAPAVVCGEPGPGHVQLAGGAGFRMTASFSRVGRALNEVQADLDLSLDKAGSSRSVAVQEKVVIRHASN
jgi:prepilin-type N-terminal cleavage/methylation domain-containing protein